jgi:AraC family transcriptional regulator of adaptative response / DNA-3-methyladenine glycosylase II
MPMAEVALAAGFNSIRRFNATFQTLYQRPPRELRRSQLADAEQPGAEGITLRLPYAPPYDWDAMIDFLGARAIRGIEAVDGRRCYRRSIALDGAQGVIRVEPDDREPALCVSIRFPQVSALAGIVQRVRRVFDLSADPLAIGDDLARDPLLAPLVAKHPGLRVPGAWDGFEVAIRAILGQQTSPGACKCLSRGSAANGIIGWVVRMDSALALQAIRAATSAVCTLGRAAILQPHPSNLRHERDHRAHGSTARRLYRSSK